MHAGGSVVGSGYCIKLFIAHKALGTTAYRTVYQLMFNHDLKQLDLGMIREYCETPSTIHEQQIN